MRDGAPLVSRAPYVFPFREYQDWLAFMDQSPDPAWGSTAMRELVPEETYRRYRDGTTLQAHDIVYRSQGLEIRGLLIAPRRTRTPCPVVLFAHGGVAEWGRITFFDVLEMHRLAETGVVVLASALRGEGGSEGTPNLGAGDRADLLELLEVAARVDGADPTRVGLWGFSRGGADRR